MYVLSKESLAAFSQPPEGMSQALALQAAFLHSGHSAPLREEPSQSPGRFSPTHHRAAEAGQVPPAQRRAQAEQNTLQLAGNGSQAQPPNTLLQIY